MYILSLRKLSAFVEAGRFSLLSNYLPRAIDATLLNKSGYTSRINVEKERSSYIIACIGSSTGGIRCVFVEHDAARPLLRVIHRAGFIVSADVLSNNEQVE